MTLMNCKECGKLVIRSQTDYCTECQSLQDHRFFQVRNYLRVHPSSTVWEVAQKTGIPLNKILELNKEQYITFGS
jgi:uncharacterized OB-fold protein